MFIRFARAAGILTHTLLVAGCAPAAQTPRGSKPPSHRVEGVIMVGGLNKQII